MILLWRSVQEILIFATNIYLHLRHGSLASFCLDFATCSIYIMASKTSYAIEKDKPSKCKCQEYIINLLNAFVSPFTCCMRLSCWSKRRYLQYDLSVQCYGIFQTMIGILWASTFLDVMEFMRNDNQVDVVLLSSYCILTYALCNVIVIVMQRSKLFGQKIVFFVGISGRIVAFGMKYLFALIYETHFAYHHPFGEAAGYLLICVAISVFCIDALFVLRKKCCFITSAISSIELGSRLRNLSRSLIQKESIRSYESDMMHLFLSEKHDEYFQQNLQNEFIQLVRKIDKGVFTIAIGYLFSVQMIYAAHFTFALHGDGTHNILLLIISKVVIALCILLIFIVLLNVFTYLQMKRDRAAHNIFETMKNKQMKLPSEKTDHLTKIESKIGICCIGICTKLLHRFYKLTEHTISFMIGSLGWSFGFAMVSEINIIQSVLHRLYFSICMTAFGMIVLSIRSRRQKNALQKWKTAEFENSEKRIESDESDDNEENICGNVSFKLYKLSHMNYFFRKAYGLMVALPWQLTITQLLATSSNDQSVRLALSFLLAICASVLLGWTGIKFIEIEQHTRADSTLHCTNAIIREKYMQMKSVQLSVIERTNI